MLSLPMHENHGGGGHSRLSEMQSSENKLSVFTQMSASLHTHGKEKVRLLALCGEHSQDAPHNPTETMIGVRSKVSAIPLTKSDLQIDSVVERGEDGTTCAM